MGLDKAGVKLERRVLKGWAFMGVRRLRCHPTAMAALLLCCVYCVLGDAQNAPVRRVLILNDYGIAHPSVITIDQGIRESLGGSHYEIQYYHEYMETELFSDAADQKNFRDLFIRRYTTRRPDVIITVGPSPLKLMTEVHDQYFAGVPVIFSLPLGTESELRLGPEFTGVTGELRAAETVQAALRLLPKTKRIVVVGGVAEFDKLQMSDVNKQLSGFKGRLEISFLTDLNMDALLDRLKHLPERSVVLFTSITRDTEGRKLFTSPETGPLVAGASNAPVFSLFDVYLNHGEVGGDVSSVREQGRVAGRMATRVLEGTPPAAIPPAVAINTFIFDWRALKRWGLNPGRLPPGSLVLNREKTFWEQYKWYIVAGFSLFVAETVLVFALLWNLAKRKRAEAEVSDTYERLHLALNSGKSVAWESREGGRTRVFGDLHSMFGLLSDTLECDLKEINRWVYPADRRQLRKKYIEAVRTHNPFRAEFRVIGEDGSIRWVVARGTATKVKNASSDNIRGIAVDISDRKRAEEAITSLSGRLIKSQEDEQRRIAREIHDDYGQNLAMISIELKRLVGQTASEDANVGRRLQELSQRVDQLIDAMRHLSHSLHSSTLEILGLAGGLKSFCNEFTKNQNIQVNFDAINVPRGIPQELASCIFRITQEALRNIGKHSRADRADVRVEWTGEKLHLSIRDEGIGFDPRSHSPEAGIGLRSMEERLRMLGGQIDIRSQPGRGTRIHAWLPCKVAISPGRDGQVHE